MKKISMVVALLCFAAGQASSEPFEEQVEGAIADVPAVLSGQPQVSAPVGEVIIAPPTLHKAGLTDAEKAAFLELATREYSRTGKLGIVCKGPRTESNYSGQTHLDIKGTTRPDGSLIVDGYVMYEGEAVYQFSSDITISMDGSFSMRDTSSYDEMGRGVYRLFTADTQLQIQRQVALWMEVLHTGKCPEPAPKPKGKFLGLF